jgi:hypothetical protein
LVKISQDTAALFLLLILGLVPRLVFVSSFPTVPFSDFRMLVEFGLHMREHGLVAGGWFWDFFNPGLPLVLTALFRVASADPDTIARLATALACGLMPIVPFLIWRGILPFWVRITAGVSLAIWPGQIVFSGVVAQDNWVLLPAIALGALATRSLLSGEPGPPVLAGFLYVFGGAIRQEMLVVLFPLLLAAIRVDCRLGRSRRLLILAICVGIPLLMLAAHRHAATGRFALNSEHAGLAILGSFVPGASASGWIDPRAFVASVEPELLRNQKILLAEASGLAVREALRRPGYHAARMVSNVLTYAVAGEASNLYWSVGAPDVLPATLKPQGSALVARLERPLRIESAAIHGLFIAALIVGIRWWRPAILTLGSAILLKFAIHGVTVVQGRYFLAATALELLVIALAMWEVRRHKNARFTATMAVAAAGIAFGLLILPPRLAASVQRQDIDSQRIYRFVLEPSEGGATLACRVDRGLLTALDPPRTAALRSLQSDPAPGDLAVAICDLSGSGTPAPMTLQLLDAYAPGGFPDRMMQRVRIDGSEIFAHDIAKEPGSGWAKIPLGMVGAGTSRKVVIEIEAVRPDAGPGWGNAAQTVFQISSYKENK